MQKDTVKLSLIVCTYNRADLLEQALLSILRQPVATSLYEIVIVDNNSTDHTNETASRFSARHDHVRSVFEKKQGLSHSRNRGLKEARGEWLAFLDDDAELAEGYMERAFRTIRRYKIDGFGGPVKNVFRRNKPRWYKDTYHALDYGYDGVAVLKKRFLWGSNMILRKQALLEIGGFSPDLGMKGDQLRYGEDIELQVRLMKEKYVLAYDGKLIVYHIIRAEKCNVRWMLISSFVKECYYWDMRKIRPSFAYAFSHGIACCCLALAVDLPRNFFNLPKKDYYLENFIVDTSKYLLSASGRFYGYAKSKLWIDRTFPFF